MRVHRAAILLALGAAFLLSPPLVATAAGEPLIGYNDDFNVFEPHDVNDPDEIIPGIGLPFDPPIDPPLVGGGEPEEMEPGRAALIRTARLGGADVVRYVVPWLRVERKQGRYDWSVEDETYDLVGKAGLRPLIVFTTSPCWAHPSQTCNYEKYRSIRPDPKYRAAFGRFARAAIKRYPDAVAFEVWNESNAKPYWGPDPSPRSYRALLGQVWKRTRDISPRPTILYNGLLPGGNWKRYLRRSYRKHKVGRISTGLAMHPYVGDRGARLIRRRIDKARKLLRKNGVPRRIWITEVGWSTNPDASDAVTLGQQDRYVEGLERIARKRQLKAIIVHRLKDLAHRDSWEAGLGAITRSGAPKPVFCSLAARHRPSAAAPPGC